MGLGYKAVVLSGVLTALLFAPLSARGDDVADLKTAFEQLVKALNSRDLNTLSALWHEHITTFQPTSPFPLDGPAMQRRVFQSLFENAESITVIPINPQFRVVNHTGMVWGHFTLIIKPKDGPVQTSFLRSTFIWTKADGKWVELAVHHSRIPAGD